MPALTLRTHLAVLYAVLSIAISGCGASSTDEHTITILAASSLTESITEIANAYEAEHPGTRIDCAFAGSQILAAQILEGARFDVFLSADDHQMTRVEGLVDEPIAFAQGRLVVITPARSTHPDALTALSAASRIAIAAPEVPAGRYARAACEQLDIWDAVKPKALALEESVRGALTRVIMGEADAGIVYASDTLSAPSGSITIHEFNDRVNTRAQYLAAISTESTNQSAARAFLNELTTSTTAQDILRAHGFDAP